MQNEEEKNIDIKGTFEKFINPEEPELEQKEAIMKYSEKKKKNSNNDEGENTEEQEHLKRIKQELLESLKRVETLEKNIYGVKEKEVKINEKYKQKVKQIEKTNEEKSNIEVEHERE